MFRSSFGLASLLGGLALLNSCGVASAQWFGGSSNCGCSAPSYMGPPPIMRQTAAAFGMAAATPVSYAYNDGVQCGPPIACRIEQPIQAQVVHVQAVAPVQQTVVAVQQLQPVVQPIMQTVQATEMRPVKQMVNKPVVTTEYVDQAYTVMTPVSETKTMNVATTDYQTVTEYKTVQKQVGYWVTKNIPTNKMSAYQYDNRPNALGAMNRASYNMRTAFTPPFQQVRQFVPQTMTCTVPCKRQVAVPGMKQVTYNVTRMQPTQSTRKVAVNKVTYQATEVTVMAPFQVTKTVQVGHRLSYADPKTLNAAGIGTALAPTADPNSSAVAPRRAQTAEGNDKMDANKFGDNNKSSSLETIDPAVQRMTDNNQSTKKFVASTKPEMVPAAIRTSMWVARTPASTKPQPGGKSAAISIADSTR